MPDAIWEPSPELIERTRMREYMRWLAAERGHEFSTYDELWHWSVSDLDGFWASLWDFFEIAAD